MGFAANEGTYAAIRNGTLGSGNALQPGPVGSIESFAHNTGLPRFLLDLREAQRDPEVVKLLRSELEMRSIGAMAIEDQFSPTAILEYYDVLAWVDRTEASRPIRYPDAGPKK